MRWFSCGIVWSVEVKNELFGNGIIRLIIEWSKVVVAGAGRSYLPPSITYFFVPIVTDRFQSFNHFDINNLCHFVNRKMTSIAYDCIKLRLVQLKICGKLLKIVENSEAFSI